MDANKSPHGRSKVPTAPNGREIRSCRYCKGKFEVDPHFPHKEFCKDTHRKLYWRYGSQSVGKVAERIERDMRKLIAAELAELRKRVDELERERSAERWIASDPEAGEPASIDWDTIDRNRREEERAKRGGARA